MAGFLRGIVLGTLTSAVAFGAFAVLVPIDADRSGGADAVTPPANPPVTPPAEPVAAVSVPSAPAPVAPQSPQSPPADTAEPVAPEAAPVVAEPAVEPAPGGPINIGAPSIGAPDSFESSGLARLGGGSDSAPARPRENTQVAIAQPPAPSSAPTVDTQSAAVPEVSDAGAAAVPEDTGLVTLAPKPLFAGAALETHAAQYSGNDGKPMMAIILQDDGAAEALRLGLLALSAPITFGVTANLADAQRVALDYRSKGYEVVAVLPSTGQTFDRSGDPAAFADLIGGVLDAVPVAATLMDRIGGPLPRDNVLVRAALDAVAVTGHGLLTYRGTGLNNVPQQAAEVGIPSALVYRVIDSEPGAENISQALDRAVLEASKTGSIIVVGRVRPETVTAIFSWLLSPGAKAVSIAPVSAILREAQ